MRRSALGVVVLVLALGTTTSTPSSAAPESPYDLAPGQVTAVAGLGEPGFSGDGGPALDARIGSESTVVVDPKGRLFIADSLNDRVRMVDTDGRVRTVYESLKHCSDRRSGVSSCDYGPTSVATGADGSLYIGDSAVRRMRPDGTVRTLADISRVSDLAVDARGNVYVADRMAGLIRKIDRRGAVTTIAGGGSQPVRDGLRATKADLGDPESVGVDSTGRVYITSYGEDGYFLRLDTNGLLTQMPLPPDSDARVMRLSVDNADRVLLVAEESIWRLELSARRIDTPITKIRNADDIAAGPNGDVYVVADARVQLVVGSRRPTPPVRTPRPGPNRWADEAPGTVLPIAGSADPRPRNRPMVYLPDRIGVRSVVADGRGSRYFTRYDSNQVFRIDSAGRITTIAGRDAPGGSGDGGPASGSALSAPAGLAVDRSGNLYIADSGNDRIRRIDLRGRIGTVAGRSRAQHEQRGGGVQDGPAREAALAHPEDVAVDAEGNLYIADTGNNQVHRVDQRTGAVRVIAGRGHLFGNDPVIARLEKPSAVAVDSKGNVYVTDEQWRNAVRRIAPDGRMTVVAGKVSRSILGRGEKGFAGDGGPGTSALLNLPSGLVVDDNDNLYVADTWNDRIRRVTPDGRIGTVAGSLDEPSDVAVDPSDGALLIAETRADRIARAVIGGKVAVLADARKSRDQGVPASEVVLESVDDLAVDADGAVYLLDRSRSETGRVDRGRYTRIRPFPGRGGGSGTAHQLALGPTGELIRLAGGIERLGADGRAVRVAGGGQVEWEPEGPVLHTEAVATTLDLQSSKDLAVGSDGRIIYASTRTVSLLLTSGRLRHLASLDTPISALAVEESGQVLVGTTDRVYRIVRYGLTEVVAGRTSPPYEDGIGDGGPATKATVTAGVRGLAVAPDGSVYLTDHNGIRRIASDGTITTVLPSAGVRDESGRTPYAPGALAVDPHGNVYFADQISNRVFVLVAPDETSAPARILWTVVLAVVGFALLVFAAARRIRRRSVPRRSD